MKGVQGYVEFIVMQITYTPWWNCKLDEAPGIPLPFWFLFFMFDHVCVHIFDLFSLSALEK